MSGLIIPAVWLVVALGLSCALAYHQGKNPEEFTDPGLQLVILFWPLTIAVGLLMSPVLIARAFGERHRSSTPSETPNDR